MNITAPGLVTDLPESDYHADPTVVGSLSSTGAKEILRSPAHYRHMKDNPIDPTPPMVMGSAVHSMVLGDGPQVVPCPYTSWRSKEAKEERAAIEADGHLALLDEDYARAQAITEAVYAHGDAAKLLNHPGDSEVSAFAEVDGIMLRGRYDRLTSSGLILDLKCLRSADPHEFVKSAYFGHALQAAHYLRLYQAATGREARGFIHIVVASEAPHLVSVNRLDDEFLSIGSAQLDEAIRRYKHCKATGEWPGYPDQITTIRPKGWMIRETEERYQ